jgi:hypothetical protein
MAIKYACFISYPHSQGMLKPFIEFKQTLETYLSLYVEAEVYMDTDRLKPGYMYNEAIAKAICESACMVVVFSPLYEHSPYCLQEFLAMEAIEKKRKKTLGRRYGKNRSMILPVILRGSLEDLPPKIKSIQYIDISKFMLTGLTRSMEYRKVMAAIAAAIIQHYKELKDLDTDGLNEDCNSFVLPSEEEAKRSWNKSSKPIGFPGREIY